MSIIEGLMKETKLPVIIASHQGIIEYINAPFQETFGWTPADLYRKSLTTIIPSYLHDAHNLGFSRFLVTGKPTLLNRPLQLKIITKEGVEIDSEHIIHAEQHDGQWKFGATICPIQVNL